MLVEECDPLARLPRGFGEFNVSKTTFFRADYVLVESISIFRFIRKIKDKG